MVNHLGDHRNLPLLFGVVVKGEQLMLITQFHGEDLRSVTLSMAIKRASSCPHASNLTQRLKIQQRGGREAKWHVERGDYRLFGKARFISDPKPRVSLMASGQQSFKRRYPHIAPEIVVGSSRQSVQSDVFSLGRIVLSILDLLPTATAMSLRIAKRAILDNPRSKNSSLHCKCKRRTCSNDFGYSVLLLLLLSA